MGSSKIRLLPLILFAFSIARGSTPAAIQNGLLIGGALSTRATAFDAAGNLYLAGLTAGLANAPHRTVFGPASQTHLFVIKVAASRQQILYIAEVGSSQADDFGAFTVDALGNAYLAGYTRAADFPSTSGAYQAPGPQGGSFIVKLDPSGTQLTYATVLDHSAFTLIQALAVNGSGEAYAAGRTDGLTFPTTPGAYLRQVPADIEPGTNTVGFITKLNAGGSALGFSTLLGGTYDEDWISGIALAADGTIHVAGRSYSMDFPKTTGFQPPNFADNSFRARLDATGSHLLYSTLLGGTDPLGMVLDGQGNEWLVENVNESVFVQGWDASDNARSPVLLAKSTATSIAILPSGSLMIGGLTNLVNFPTVDAIQPCSPNVPPDPPGLFPGSVGFSSQGFVLQISLAAKIAFATFVSGAGTQGGSVVAALAPDPKGTVQVTGAGNAPFTDGAILLEGAPASIFSFRLDLAQVAVGNPAPACLIDGLSFAPSPLSPGSFATLFGSNLGPQEGATFTLTPEQTVPTSLAGVQVTVGGIPAPLLYAQDRQINFLVPQAATDPADVCVSRASAKTCLFSYVTPVWPNVFSVFSQGVFAILNEDGTLNTPQNPAARGSYVSLYGAGFGGYTRSFPDGAITDLPFASLTRPVAARFYDPRQSCTGIGGTCILYPIYQGQVTFAGAAPLAVNGLTQINVKVPEIPVSGTTRLDLIIEGERPAQVRISVK